MQNYKKIYKNLQQNGLRIIVFTFILSITTFMLLHLDLEVAVINKGKVTDHAQRNFNSSDNTILKTYIEKAEILKYTQKETYKRG